MKKNGIFTDGVYLNGLPTIIQPLNNATFEGKNYTVLEPEDDIERRTYSYTCNVDSTHSHYKNIYLFTGMYTNKNKTEYYFKGKPGSGFYEDVFYIKGVPCTDIINSDKYNKLPNTNEPIWKESTEIAFLNGKKITGFAFGRMWADGKIDERELIYNNRLFKHGELFSGTINVITTTMKYGEHNIHHTQLGEHYYQHGVLANGVINNILYKQGVKCEETTPNQPLGVVIYFYKGKIANGVIGESKYLNGVIVT